MFEKRSRDGKIVCIVSYSYQLHRYNVNKYYDGDYLASFAHSDLAFCIEYVEETIKKYDLRHPTDQRYHKLHTGDIYCNETETIVNHTALIDLLNALERNEETQQAIEELIK